MVFDVTKDMSCGLDPVPDAVPDVVGNVKLSHPPEETRVAEESAAVVPLIEIEVE